MADNFLANAGFLKLYWSLGGELAINTIGLRLPPGIIVNAALAASVGAAVKAAYTSHLAPLQPNLNGIVRVGIRDFRQPNLPEFRETGAIAAGTEPTAQSLPNQVALCVTQRTGMAGRANRGRTYIPGFSETQNDINGRTVTAASNGAVAFMGAVKAAVEASGMFVAVVSKPSDEYVVTRKHIRNGDLVEETVLSHVLQKAGGTHDVTAFEARTANWETQRRRANAKGGAIPATAIAELRFD